MPDDRPRLGDDEGVDQVTIRKPGPRHPAEHRRGDAWHAREEAEVPRAQRQPAHELLERLAIAAARRPQPGMRGVYLSSIHELSMAGIAESVN